MRDRKVFPLKAMAVLGGLLAFAAPSFAQDFSAMDMTGMYVYSQESAMKEAAVAAAETVVFSRSNAEPIVRSAASFRYNPSKTRTRANMAQFVSRTRAANPAEGEKLASFFASTDLVGEMSSGMRKIGLQPNDVADAYALWWVIAWYAVQGRESIPDPTTLASVREQAARALQATGKFDRASDKLRQEMAESLLVQAGMTDAANDQMRGDPNQRRALSTAVNKGARGMGLDLTSMTLTKQGFQPRRRSDAGEAIGDVEGAEPEALAASSVTGTPANDTDDRTGTYALIAAAGGAGLAGIFMVGRAAGRKG